MAEEAVASRPAAEREVEVDELYERLVGEKPSAQAASRLRRVQNALGLRSNDALWQLLIALEYYEGQYDRVPQSISRACESTLARVEKVSEEQLRATSAKVQADLVAAAKVAASSAARGATAKQLVQWGVGAVLLVSLIVGAAGFWSYRQGFAAGEGSGSSRSAWANSSDGKLAFELSRTGSLRILARCEGPGWKLDGGKCYPQPLRGDTVFGWQVPK